MTQEQRKRYVELMTKIGTIDEISELGSLIMIEQSEYTKDALVKYFEYKTKDPTKIGLMKFIKQEGI